MNENREYEGANFNVDLGDLSKNMDFRFGIIERILDANGVSDHDKDTILSCCGNVKKRFGIAKRTLERLNVPDYDMEMILSGCGLTQGYIVGVPEGFVYHNLPIGFRLNTERVRGGELFYIASHDVASVNEPLSVYGRRNMRPVVAVSNLFDSLVNLRKKFESVPQGELSSQGMYMMSLFGVEEKEE